MLLKTPDHYKLMSIMLCVLLRGTNKVIGFVCGSLKRHQHTQSFLPINVMASKELHPFCGLKLFLGTFKKEFIF